MSSLPRVSQSKSGAFWLAPRVRQKREKAKLERTGWRIEKRICTDLIIGKFMLVKVLLT